LTSIDSMHLAIFLENFLLFFQFLIQIWKHVKFYTNSFFSTTGNRSNRSGIPVKPIVVPVGPDCTAWFEFKFEFIRFPAGSRPNRSGKSVPDLAGSVRSVGIKNLGADAAAHCAHCTETQCKRHAKRLAFTQHADVGLVTKILKSTWVSWVKNVR
jgi:hypothetical protein